MRATVSWRYGAWFVSGRPIIGQWAGHSDDQALWLAVRLNVNIISKSLSLSSYLTKINCPLPLKYAVVHLQALDTKNNVQKSEI